MKQSMLPIRGCVDYTPAQMARRQAAIDIILNTYRNNGFLQIKTPILENLELLCKGDAGDNTKLMFKTIKRGEKLDLTKPNLTEADLTEEGLRYDLTVPLARFFAGNKNDLPFPFKSIQVDESFRAERPQKGRNRQFTQCDVDIFGEKTILGEMEIITTFMQAYKNMGLDKLVVKLNSRKILQALILAAGFKAEDGNDVCIVIDKIDKIGLDGCNSELLSRGFLKTNCDSLCNLIAKVREKGLDYLIQNQLAQEEAENIKTLIQVLKQYIAKDYDAVFDIGIVRGQGYYTGTVFEVFQKEGNYKGALGGGGRYDTMIEKMIGESVPAIGFGLGLDTVLLVLDEQNKNIGKTRKKIALLYDKDEKPSQVMHAKHSLMKDYDVTVLPKAKNFAEQERKLKLCGFDEINFFIQK